MTKDISYTPEEAANILKISRYTVYEIIKRGELPAYRIGRKVRIEAKDLDNYKQRGKGITSQTTQLPVKEESIKTDNNSIILCGQDIILDILTKQLEKQLPKNPIYRQYTGSISGLLALYYGTANVVTAHLWDSDNDEYNLPYVRRLLPGHAAVVINLVYRYEGFYVENGNPKKISSWEDLTRTDINFVNREKGAGVRVLLDEKLRKLGLNRQEIRGYNHEETSHLAVASLIARGEADVGIGIEKVADQIKNIDFIPLQKERVDIVIRKEDFNKPSFQILVQILQSEAFRAEVAGMGGYDVSQMGEIIAEI